MFFYLWFPPENIVVDPGIPVESITLDYNRLKVAVVDSKGKITAVGKGTTYVRVKTTSGKTAKLKVVVK